MRAPPVNAVRIRGLAPAAMVTAYNYLRGPGAWCCQLIGLDGLIAVVLVVMCHSVGCTCPPGGEMPEQAV